MNPKIKELRKKSMSLPLCPGVYLMKNKSGNIIYIGKAKKLKNRVSSYFGSNKQHTLKVIKMVEQVDNFDYILCDSEFEALILECSLIKQHSPKYNILLKDDKGYHYIKISGEWPTIKEVKQKLNDNAEYIGPYNSGYILKQTVDMASKIYQLPRCSKQFPRDYGKSKPCLNYHIGLCSAPCGAKIKKDEYLKATKSAIQFIKGEGSDIIKQLEEQMNDAVETLNFEQAAKIRDRIKAVKKVKEKQKVVISSCTRQDVIASARTNDSLCFAVMKFETGHLTDLQCYRIKEPSELKADRTEFIERYYSKENNIPKRIVIEDEIENKEIISKWLTEKAGHTVNFVVPQKGEQQKLVKLCSFNAAEYLAKQEQRNTPETAALDELSRLLGLKKPPEYIEAYDISNTAGSENVAGMTVFKKGRPLKAAYRHFKIKGFDGQDDYRSMAEVLERRFNEYVLCKEKNAEIGFGVLPDLILLDGGLGQINAVLPVIKKYNLNIPVFGMVKDSKHKTRAIAAKGGDISIKSNQRAFLLISTIQEETHRYAISFHRKQRSKNSFFSELNNIEGMGPARINALLKAFKTEKSIKSASAKEISQKAKIPQKIAETIVEFYK